MFPRPKNTFRAVARTLVKGLLDGSVVIPGQPHSLIFQDDAKRRHKHMHSRRSEGSAAPAAGKTRVGLIQQVLDEVPSAAKTAPEDQAVPQALRLVSWHRSS